MSFLSRIRQLFGGDQASTSEPSLSATLVDTPASAGPAGAQRDAGKRREQSANSDALEELLIDAGIDVETTLAILQEVHRTSLLGRPTADQIIERIRTKLTSVLDLDTTLRTSGSPAVILVTGVNGVGKTSSIAKLANMLRTQGLSVLLIAADTFRAGAVDQLAILADRVGVPVMRSVEGQDPSSVVFNGLQKAIADHVDLVLIDTAGRLENKKNLTAELQKVVRLIESKFGLPLTECLLVIDATTGENALMQARAFSEAVPVSGIILTKVDSGAKGGSIVSIARELHIPIKLVCNGEGLESIKPFDKDELVNMMLLSD